MNAQDQKVIEAMKTRGGGFDKALAEAATCADSDNLHRLKQAFPELWNSYTDKLPLRDQYATRDDLADALEEMLADAETLKEPYRNEAICERARNTLSKYQNSPHHWHAFGDHPLEDWCAEVANNETRLGYLEWAACREESKTCLISGAPGEDPQDCTTHDHYIP